MLLHRDVMYPFSLRITFHYMILLQFTHFPFDGHLGYFQLGTILNSAAMNLLLHVFCCVFACISPGYISKDKSTGPQNVHL